MVIEPGEVDERDLDTAAPPAAPETQPDAGSQPEQPDTSTGTDATEDDAPKTMAEAIERALDGEGGTDTETGDGEGDKPKPEPKPAPAPAEKVDPAAPKEPQPEPDKTGTDDDDPTEDELKAMRPGPRNRITKLLSQRNGFRREVAEVTAKYEAERTDATAYREVRQFMQQARLEPAEVQELFSIGQALKSNDPKQFEQVLAVLVPLTTGLLELTGRAVPADLRKKVEDGELTEELARDLSRERGRARIAEQQATTVQTEVQTQQQRTQVTQLQQSVKQAVDAWVATVKKSDPDFERKAAALEDAAHGIMQRMGPPRSPEHAVELAKAAYERVNANYRAARPAPSASRPNPGSGQSGNRAALTPAPKSLDEAIRNAMRQTA